MNKRKLNKTGSESNKLFNEILFVPLVLSSAYLGTYSFYFMYGLEMGIPISLISIGIEMILKTCIITLLTLLFFLTFLNSISKQMNKDELTRDYILLFILITVFFIIIGSIIYIDHVLFLLVEFLIYFSVCLYIYESYKKQKPIKETKKDNDIIDRFISKFGKIPVFISTFLMFFILILGMYGVKYSELKKEYWITESYPNHAVVLINSNNFILMKYNKNKTFNPNFLILTFDEISRKGLVFKKAKIGPLRKLD